MKTKEKYYRPESEIIEIVIEGVIANSPPDTTDINLEGSHSGGAGAKRRDFWD